MSAIARPKLLSSHDGRREDLLRVGRSLRVLAMIVILLLSLGVGVLAVQQWFERSVSGQSLPSGADPVLGFGLLMILTIGYLVGKSMSTTKNQRVMIAQLLDEESISRARHLDPTMDFHHPELCREILMRQANYAGRIGSPISLIELSVPELPRLSLDEKMRPAMEEFFQEMRRHSRPLDFWIRWTQTSFLLVLIDLTPDETAGVLYRLRTRLTQWWQQRGDTSGVPDLEWRYRSVGSLGASGDVLREVATLMDPDRFTPTPMADVWQCTEAAPEAPPPRARR